MLKPINEEYSKYYDESGKLRDEPLADVSAEKLVNKDSPYDLSTWHSAADKKITVRGPKLGDVYTIKINPNGGVFIHPDGIG